MYWLKKNLPKIVVAPSFAVILWFVYGFIGWTFYISLTKSKLLPNYEFGEFTNMFGYGKCHVGI